MPVPAVDVVSLQTTVAFWRDKASDIEARYGKEAPVMVDHITSGIRACCQDIEAHIRDAERRAKGGQS